MDPFEKWQKERSASQSAPSTPIINEDLALEENPAEKGIGKNRKILVVDDDAVVLKAFELKLKASGFAVFTATEGAAAVSVARQTKLDIIVLDINFPIDFVGAGLQWDGFNIMEWFRRFDEIANVPKIIISSSEPGKFKEKAIAAGAVAFFQKPINYADFVTEVRRCIG
jgi:CheY-like chemotaxis protein